ncbi:dUTP diphosphatase [[Clostridium] innocuum]|uniref:dUTP diphosphatase n=1 Tax=Clostridium innocuum TaxID=1522 RepID=UPI003259A88D
MERIAKFHKVSMQQFENDWSAAFPEVTATEIQRIYEELRLPVRATRGSAGYDFFAPAAFTLKPRETLKIPTGIRAEIQEGWVLQLFPRSSLGFTYRLQFNNTVGIIDSDYFESDNEGHIFIKLMNDSTQGKIVQLRANDGFAQGIFLPFGICEDDAAQEQRNGGFGSTNK